MQNFVHNVGIHPSIGAGIGYHASGPGLVASGVSTASIAPVTLNTTGATLLVTIVSAGSAPNIADLVGGNTNAWNLLTPATGSSNSTVIAYAYSKTGGVRYKQDRATHLRRPGRLLPAAVYAFSGTLTSASVFDSSNQSSNNGTGTPTTFQPGSVTPTLFDLVVCGFGNNGTTNTGTINDSFTGVLLQTSGASFEIVGGAYLLNAANSPLNPTWTSNTTATTACVIACFK